jgi:hypothetical protein
MPKITILHRYTEAVLFEHEVSDEVQASGLAVRHALEAAVKSGANLSYANLSYAYLSDAYLSYANLSYANLSYAYLSGANLRGANLSGANLSDAYLSGANLRGANLSGAYLSDANLSYAYLSYANLSGAKIKTGLELSGARPALFIGPIGSEQRTITAWVTTEGLRIQAGRFFGTRDEFTARLAKTHGNNEHAREYTAALVLIDMHSKLWEPAVAVEAVAA